MNRDNLKNFIQQHRDEFDTELPPEHIWDDLNKKLKSANPKYKSKSKPLYYFIGGVAATLLLMIVAVAGYQLGKNNNTLNYDEIYSQYRLQEKKLVAEVNYKISQVDENRVDPAFKSDLMQLDAIYQELKAELIENQYGNSDEIIKALIINYHTKIELLEIILEKQSESIKKEEYEALDI